MSTVDVATAQRLEFLEAEIQECRSREASLRKMNDSLIAAMQEADHSHMQNHVLTELEKVTRQFTKEIEDVKLRAKEDKLLSERTIRDLKSKVNTLELELNQIQGLLVKERIESKENLKQVEAEKTSMAMRIKALEEEGSAGKAGVVHELELKLHSAERELLIQQEEARTEVLKARESADKTVSELKSLFHDEISVLKSQISSLKAKNQRQHEKIMQLREGNTNEELYAEEIERLQSELDNVRFNVKSSRYPSELEEERDSLVRQVEELQYKLKRNEEMMGNKQEIEQLRLENERLEEVIQEHSQDLTQTEDLLLEKEREIVEQSAHISSLSRELEDTRRAKLHKQPVTLHWQNEPRPHLYDSFSTLLSTHDPVSVDKRAQELRLELEKTQVQRDRAIIERDKALLELKHRQMEWLRGDEKRAEKEKGLKNEVKYLIGKLLKAKGKHEVELNETLRKETVSRTVLQKSVVRSRISPYGRPVTPLNLSVISRSGSPFTTSEYDIY